MENVGQLLEQYRKKPLETSTSFTLVFSRAFCRINKLEGMQLCTVIVQTMENGLLTLLVIHTLAFVLCAICLLPKEHLKPD